MRGELEVAMMLYYQCVMIQILLEAEESQTSIPFHRPHSHFPANRQSGWMAPLVCLIGVTPRKKPEQSSSLDRPLHFHAPPPPAQAAARSLLPGLPKQPSEQTASSDSPGFILLINHKLPSPGFMLGLGNAGYADEW